MVGAETSTWCREIPSALANKSSLVDKQNDDRRKDQILRAKHLSSTLNDQPCNQANTSLTRKTMLRREYELETGAVMQHHVRLATSSWENTFGDIWWFLKKPFCLQTPHHWME